MGKASVIIKHTVFDHNYSMSIPMTKSTTDFTIQVDNADEAKIQSALADIKNAYNAEFGEGEKVSGS